MRVKVVDHVGGDAVTVAELIGADAEGAHGALEAAGLAEGPWWHVRGDGLDLVVSEDVVPAGRLRDAASAAGGALLELDRPYAADHIVLDWEH